MNCSVHVLRTALAAASLLLAAVPLPAQHQWSTFQANAAHDAYVPETIDPGRLALAWETSLHGLELQQVTVADSRVHATTDDERLSVLDAATGELLWTRAYPGVFSVSQAAVHSGRVFLQTCNFAADTWLRCFDAASGAPLFRTPIAAQRHRFFAPTLRGGVVYANGGEQGGLYAIDAASCRQLWFTPLADSDLWTPAVDDRFAYAYVHGRLTVLDRHTGSVHDVIDDPGYVRLRDSMYLAPVLGGRDDVFVIQAGRLVKFDLAGARVADELAERYGGQPAVRAGVVYAVNDGRLEARDQDDLRLLWDWAELGRSLQGSPAVTDGHVIVRSRDFTFVVDLQAQQGVWSVRRAGTAVVAQGALYIGESDGRLSCYRYAPLPDPQQVDPAHAHFARPLPSVTVSGEHFSGNGSVEVRFGGEPASEVVVVDDRRLRCRPPVRGPGRVDVVVGNELGRRRLSGGFTYLPAVVVSGDHRPGGSVGLEFVFESGDQLLGLVGVAAVSGTPVPPFAGELRLTDYWPLFSVPFTPGAGYRVELPIPNDPAVRGARVGFQALVGPELRAGGPVAGAFTDLATVEIR